MSTAATAARAGINISELVDFGSFHRSDAAGRIPLQDIEWLVQDSGASWESGPFVWQRRRGHRTAYRDEIVLIPADDGEHLWGEPSRVHGKELSAHGVSFTHEKPLPHRVVALVLRFRNGVCATILTRLKWCRFTRDGRYESGGEFLRVVQTDPPFGAGL